MQPVMASHIRQTDRDFLSFHGYPDLNYTSFSPFLPDSSALQVQYIWDLFRINDFTSKNRLIDSNCLFDGNPTCFGVNA